MATNRPRRITVAELAQKLDLSRATVSLVLNGRGESHRIPKATINRVMEAAKKYNYRANIAARLLAGKRSNAIGVLISTQAIADPRLIQMMELIAAEHGTRFIVGHALGTREQSREYLDDFRDRGVDGIISIFHNHPDFADVVLPELEQFSTVVYYEKPAHRDETTIAGAWYVEPDYYRVGQLGVQHMHEHGRKRIALVLNNRKFSYAVHRYRAYVETLQSIGHEASDSLIWIMDEQLGVRWTDPFTDEQALLAVDKLVVRGKADAIVAVNDTHAARLIRALRLRSRRVPEDVAVIGCNNTEFGELVDPQLSTFDLRVLALAQAMMDLMFARLEGKNLPQSERQRVILPHLIQRASTRAVGQT